MYFCVVLCIFMLFYVLFVLYRSLYCLCVYMCTEVLPPGGYPIAVKIYHIMSERSSVCPHGTYPLPLHGCSWRLIYEFLPKICQENSSFINLLKPTGYVMHQPVQHSTIVRSAHTVFMCFVFIWEQTATCATYSINWLVFITEMKSVYSAVRTGVLNKEVCASSLKG